MNERSIMRRIARRSLTALLLPAALLTSIAGVTAIAPPQARAELAVETHDVLQFDYQSVGATEEEAVRLACIRGVRATIGRILFSDYSLQARDLLEPYIQKNWKKFTASYYVLERRFDRDGFGCRIRVQTYPEILHRDLREKKFLYLPQPNPLYAVFVAETQNGVPVMSDAGRTAILTTLENEGANVQAAVGLSPGYVVDPAVPDSITAARTAAIQSGAEVMIVGRAELKPAPAEQVYLDNLSAWDTQLTVQLVRADDGRILGAVEKSLRVSDVGDAQARQTAINTVLSDATRDLLRQSKGLRQREVLDKTAYSLMFTDLTDEEVGFISRHLESQLSYGTKAYLRSSYGNVAILNVDTDRAFAAIERAIINYKGFDLRITDRQGKRITVDVQH